VNAPVVVIMAAGHGTRMRSSTPKVLHDLCGRPMVMWPVSAALEAGAAKVVVVDSPARVLAGNLPDAVTVVVQPEANGTAGAVIAAADHLDAGAPVVVLSGDVPLVGAAALTELLEAHAACGAPATMATTRLADPRGYGRVVRDPDGAVQRVVETKADGDATPEQLAIDEVNTGIFCFDGAALIRGLPQVQAENAQGELYLPDVLRVLRAEGAAVAAHVIDDPALVLGVNDQVALAEVRGLAQRRINEAHMRNGVAIVDPATAHIGVDVTIAADTTIEPFTILRGATRIGAGCTVGPSATLVDCTLHDGVTILNAHAVQAELRDGVTVGPFAYLRPGTLVRERAKVGTFVEVKNSVLGEGAKVPHLSYIGDADVGEETNLGASTITANYDGRAKHRTTIGPRVRSGVHVSFVAPVEVGDGAVTGAGSVITEDVPDGALGVARARQVNVEGYAGPKQAP
jgi:bifunctional UDP-N-acetylglucosamine pyrophosphorylase/glucosamine-1-phosphate N-acetyltransferase